MILFCGDTNITLQNRVVDTFENIDDEESIRSYDVLIQLRLDRVKL